MSRSRDVNDLIRDGDFAGARYEEVPDEEPPKIDAWQDEPEEEVERLLDLTATGRTSTRFDNLCAILSFDSRWKGQIKSNAFAGQIYYRGEPLTDAHERSARKWLSRVYNGYFPLTAVGDAIRDVAEENSYHPLRDYLDSLQWDGVERCRHLLPTYFGTQNDELHQEMGARWMIGCVARAYVPGVQMDSALVLLGDKGFFKTGGLEALVGAHWFQAAPFDVRSKDTHFNLRGVWVWVIDEMGEIKPSEAGAYKNLITLKKFKGRAAFGRNASEELRETVFAGTSNDLHLFWEPNNRRWWPALVPRPARLPLIRRDRDQLWAEAVHRYRQQVPWWFDTGSALAKALNEHYQQFRVRDGWADQIENFVCSRPVGGEYFKLAELFRALKLENQHVRSATSMRCIRILRELGYESKSARLADDDGTVRLARWWMPKGYLDKAS